MQHNIKNQSDEVQTYFKKICAADEFGLDLDGFFNRVCKSLKVNRRKAFTVECYNLSMEMLEKINLNK